MAGILMLASFKIFFLNKSFAELFQKRLFSPFAFFGMMASFSHWQKSFPGFGFFLVLMHFDQVFVFYFIFVNISQG